MSFSKPKSPKVVEGPDPAEALAQRKAEEEEAALKARQQAALRQGRRALSNTSTGVETELEPGSATLF